MEPVRKTRKICLFTNTNLIFLNPKYIRRELTSNFRKISQQKQKYSGKNKQLFEMISRAHSNGRGKRKTFAFTFQFFIINKVKENYFSFACLNVKYVISSEFQRIFILKKFLSIVNQWKDLKVSLEM